MIEEDVAHTRRKQLIYQKVTDNLMLLVKTPSENVLLSENRKRNSMKVP